MDPVTQARWGGVGPKPGDMSDVYKPKPIEPTQIMINAGLRATQKDLTAEDVRKIFLAMDAIRLAAP